MDPSIAGLNVSAFPLSRQRTDRIATLAHGMRSFRLLGKLRLFFPPASTRGEIAHTSFDGVPDFSPTVSPRLTSQAFVRQEQAAETPSGESVPDGRHSMNGDSCGTNCDLAY
jgi:hypothetical protein